MTNPKHILATVEKEIAVPQPKPAQPVSETYHESSDDSVPEPALN